MSAREEARKVYPSRGPEPITVQIVSKQRAAFEAGAAWQAEQGVKPDRVAAAEAEVERTRGVDDPIPRYAQLDIWMALYGSSRSDGYEPFRDEHGFAEAWAFLCAEVRRLSAWKAEALPVMAGLQDLGEALGLPLGVGITGEQAAERAAELVAENAALRATVERVRGELTEPHAFAPSSDAWELGYARGYNNAREAIRLLTALDGGE